MFMVGKGHYGKCDHLTGLFFVVTEFVTVNFFPVIPLGSRGVVTQGRVLKVDKIPWSWKSMLLGYFRGIICVLSVVFLFFGICFVILDFG